MTHAGGLLDYAEVVVETNRLAGTDKALVNDILLGVGPVNSRAASWSVHPALALGARIKKPWLFPTLHQGQLTSLGNRLVRK
jgi:hypothetical protein